MSEPDNCDVCGKPMIADGHTAFYAGLRHWGCQYPNGYKSTDEVFAELDQATKRCDDALNALRRVIK